MMNSGFVSVAAPAKAVCVTSRTWARDSHELFDFESQHIESSSFSTSQSGTCVRSGNNVEMLTELDPQASAVDTLVRVEQRGTGQFVVTKPMTTGRSKKLWMVVRHMSPQGHKLCENDVIKLGRFRLRVRQLVLSDAGDVRPDLSMTETNPSSVCCAAHTEQEMASQICRICLLEGSSAEDPLIAPCTCKGSIEYVHLKCLRHWTSSRLNLADNPLGSYFYKPLACELCKSAYPAYVARGGGVQESLVEVPKTQAPFVVLEDSIADGQTRTRGLHVISLAEKALVLGRSRESDVRIADVSISRCHATIRYENGQILLQDHDSKFGTLVAMRGPQQLQASKPLSLQVGRTLLSLSLAEAAAAPTACLEQLPPRSAMLDRQSSDASQERRRSQTADAAQALSDDGGVIECASI